MRDDDELLHRFLLGKLTEDEAERVEERLLEEDELFDLCEAIEADLLEAAVRGGLAPAERERVLNRLASSPQGRARLALARNLVDIAAPRRNLLFFPRLARLAARPALRWAAAVLVALLGTWLAVDRWAGPGQEPQIAQHAPPPPADPGSSGTFHRKIPDEPVAGPVAEETLPAPEATPLDPERDRIVERTEPEPPPGDETVDSKTFVVQLAALLRTGEEQLREITIPNGMEHVAFHVPINELTLDPFDSYDAVVKREDGHKVIWRNERLEPTSIDGSPTLALTVSASDLPPGRYEVEIFGNPADGDPLMEQKFEVTGGG